MEEYRRSSRVGVPRWSLKDVKFVGFVGADFLKTLFDCAQTPQEKALISALFLTGGRCREVLGLRKGDFEPFGDEFIRVTLPLSKRYRKVGKIKKWKCVGHCHQRWSKPPSPIDYTRHHVVEYEGWKCEPVGEKRIFLLYNNELFAPYLIEYVKGLPSPESKLFDLLYSEAYRICVGAGKRANELLMSREDVGSELKSILSIHTPPHWFRAQRASYLGSKLSPEELADYFDWSTPGMAFKYSRASLSRLGEKIKEVSKGTS